MKHEEKKEFRFGRRMAVAAAGFLAFAAGAYVLVVWANTTGRLQGKIHHPYLLFDSAWGNFRGLIWSVSAKMFGQMDGVQKLVGVGPDCYQMFCYADPVLGDQLSSWFGTNQIVTNAHNEFLNVLICLGILGLAAFLAIFGTAARRFLGGFGGVGGNHSDDSLEALVLAGGLAVLTYCAHNLFCYQQVCCTPFLFLILAAAENCMRQCRAGTASMTTDRDFQS